jgi:hypothetical protein
MAPRERYPCHVLNPQTENAVIAHTYFRDKPNGHLFMRLVKPHSFEDEREGINLCLLPKESRMVVIR